MPQAASMDTGGSSHDMQVAATSLFLILPRELRDQIYDSLWSDTLIAFRHKGLVTIARYKFSSSSVVLNSLPPWLETNGQIRDEGMDHFYRYAGFSVGEQITLPLYLHRCGSARPYVSSRQHLSTSTDTIEEGQSTIQQVSSGLLDLRRARTLKIAKFCARLQVFYPSRANCLQPGRSFCIENCCAVHLKISVGTDHPDIIKLEREQAATYPLPYFQALEELLADNSIQLRDLELDIVPHSRRPTGGSGLGFARHLWLKSTELEAEMHYDWSILDKLPRNLRRVNIGIIEDTFTTRGWPNIFLLALEEVREKCQKTVADLVELRETDRMQEIHVAHWSYVRCGKPLWYYSRPEHERKPSETGSVDFFCSRWEALSPLRGPQYSRADDIDSIVERSGVGDSIISQRTTSRSTVLRHA